MANILSRTWDRYMVDENGANLLRMDYLEDQSVIHLWRIQDGSLIEPGRSTISEQRGVQHVLTHRTLTLPLTHRGKQ